MPIHQTSPTSSKAKNRKTIILLICLLAFLIFGVIEDLTGGSFGGKSSSSSSSASAPASVPSESIQNTATNHSEAVAEQNSLGSKIEAYNVAKKFVSETLKSPASAAYPGYPDCVVKLVGDNTYSVSAYVDSQNSFGALLRGNWTATVIKHNDSKDTWSCKNVNVTNQGE